MLRFREALHAVGFNAPERADGGHENRVSIELLSEGRWNEHEKAIGGFIVRARQVIAFVRRNGARVTFDTAIEPEDRVVNQFCGVSPSPTLMKALIKSGCALSVTSY